MIYSKLILLSSLLLSNVAIANCTIYQHRDFGGASYRLPHNVELQMIHSDTMCTTNGHGHGSLCPEYDASWNDQVSSFRVASGCSLTLWKHIDRKGMTWKAHKSYKYVGSRWNDEATIAYCECR